VSAGSAETPYTETFPELPVEKGEFPRLKAGIHYAMTKGVGLYLRVPTKNGQTVDNQRQALAEAIGRRPGWIIADEFPDQGISGAKGRVKRPEFDRLLKEVVRGKIDVVAAWSVDRLGRSLQDLVAFLGELNAAECDLYLEKQAVDTTTPAGRALFQMLGVFAEFERAIIQERIHAGLARARVVGTKSGKPIGRARIGAAKEAAIRTALASGKGILRTACECGTGISVAQRIKAEMARGNNATREER
jgi:DNA invertase Pin-like site-specific DNA recombinase